MNRDEPSTETTRQIGQALRQLLRLAPEVHTTLAARVGVGVTDMLALDHLTTDPDPTIGVVDLAHRLGIRSASATVLVDRLVAAGHVQRAPHPTDRRRTSLNLTDHAREEAQAALAPLITDLSAITATLDRSTAAAILGYLNDVCAALEQFTRTGERAPDADRHAQKP